MRHYIAPSIDVVTGIIFHEFKTALKEFAFAIKEYGMIALTFFGITLIGTHRLWLLKSVS